MYVCVGLWLFGVVLHFNCRPLELSSKRPTNSNTLHAKAPVSRDPRFDDLSGEYNERLFKHSYKFIDKIKKKEYKVSSVRHSCSVYIDLHHCFSQLLMSTWWCDDRLCTCCNCSSCLSDKFKLLIELLLVAKFFTMHDRSYPHTHWCFVTKVFRFTLGPWLSKSSGEGEV